MCVNCYSVSVIDGTGIKKSDKRILFQNADGDINMGVCLNDPDLTVYDICWLEEIASEMIRSLYRDEGLMYRDEESQAMSCHVELHRND